MISVVIVTYNEAEKLNKCLQSVSFADEIVVIDLESTDNTSKICKKFHAKVFKQRRVSYVEEIRNFAITKASGEWILILDPDEQITNPLEQELKDVMKEGNYAAVNIPRKNIFFGKWIRHTNWWPDRHIRFFKKGVVSWETRIHSYPKVNGNVLNLEAKESLAIIHFGYKDIGEFISRQNRYSDIEAKQRFESGETFSWNKFLWWPAREFLVRFVKHEGFLDGFYGFTLTYLMMIYKAIVLVKIWEKSKT